MQVRVLAFARLRDLFGFGERRVDCAPGATLDDLWSGLAANRAELLALRDSTRFACNGALAAGSAVLADGDEVAFLPPVGGG
jgi:molybdopterin converting factor small subunit